ncbi:hypothetical protein S40288_06414 [Stachybotrys chartarum IBT 40288]|nr:hypothetical protein S40288_06414 [Stachybotrys chartarum IBT 40288]
MHVTVVLGSAVAALAGLAAAHGSHSPKPDVPEHANWMEKHMAGKYDGQWQADEIQRTYGLMDESNQHIKPAEKDRIAKELLELMDTDGDSAVSKDEWMNFIKRGGELPDKGTGPGHHGDDEYEYDIHHWEKYHDENTKVEDLTHPEDIEHFRKHEQMEDEQERLEALDKIPIVEKNIPQKFRRVA